MMNKITDFIYFCRLMQNCNLTEIYAFYVSSSCGAWNGFRIRHYVYVEKFVEMKERSEY